MLRIKQKLTSSQMIVTSGVTWSNEKFWKIINYSVFGAERKLVSMRLEGQLGGILVVWCNRNRKWGNELQNIHRKGEIINVRHYKKFKQGGTEKNNGCVGEWTCSVGGVFFFKVFTITFIS